MHLSISGSTDGKLFQIGQVRLPVRIDDHTRVQQIIGIDQFLQATHDGIAVASPFRLDEGSHGFVRCRAPP